MICRLLVLFLLLLPFSHLSAETLKDVLNDAYGFFPDIEKSKTELMNAEKDLTISKTDFLPSLDLTASQGKNISESFPDTSNYQLTETHPSSIDIDLTQPLGYTKVVNLKQSRNELRIAKYKDASTVQQVMYRASKAYYTVLKDYFLLDVSKKNEGNLIKKLDATEKRFEFKDVTKTDVFQAKARLAEAVSKRIEAENNLEISISDFKTVVGRDPNINWFKTDETTVTNANPKDWSKFGKIPEIPSTLRNSIEIGLKKNPDYKMLELQLDNAELDIQKNRLNFTPELSITGSIGKSLDSSRTVERKESYSVTAEISVPLFNKGHNFLNLEKSRNSAIAAVKSIESKKLDLTHSIQSAWKKIESTKSSIKSLEISVDSNIIAVEGVTTEAGVGTRTTLNILDAEKELTAAESSLVNAQFQLIISSFDLLELCGLLNFDHLDL